MNNKSATDSLRRHRTVHIYIYARCRRVAFSYLDLSKDRLLSRDAKVKTHNYVEIHFHCFELYSFVRNSLHSFPIVSPLHTVHVHVRLCVNMVCRFYLKFFFYSSLRLHIEPLHSIYLLRLLLLFLIHANQMNIQARLEFYE